MAIFDGRLYGGKVSIFFFLFFFFFLWNFRGQLIVSDRDRGRTAPICNRTVSPEADQPGRMDRVQRESRWFLSFGRMEYIYRLQHSILFDSSRICEVVQAQD